MRYYFGLMMWSVLAVVLAACETTEGVRPGSGDHDDRDRDTDTGEDTGEDTVVEEETVATETEPEEETEETETESDTSVCGDGLLGENEACDDANTNDSDGCVHDCTSVEEGWSCYPPGRKCHKMAICGDGVVLSPEMCDDKNIVGGDGCSEMCQIEFGYKCEGEPSDCSPSVCGDGVQEGAESCDDGNTVPFDGCSDICQKEPDCSEGECKSECGDGFILGEECDDGNKLDGDGCSSGCVVEDGYTCDHAEACVGDDCTLVINAVYRDFSSSDDDFGVTCEGTEAVTGLVENRIGENWKPVLASDGDRETCIESRSSFNAWYTTEPTKVGTITLYPDGNGNFVNQYGENGEQWVFIDRARMIFCGNGAEVVDCTYLEDADCEVECPDVVEEYPDYVCSSPCPDDYSNRTCLTSPDPATCDDCENLAAGVEGFECLNPCGQSNDSLGFGNWDVCEYGSPREYYDGNPLFFPMDEFGGDSPAIIPPEYGYNWLMEEEVTGKEVMHNFFFTTEITYWFTYEEDETAILNFTGDDDVWVFVNGQLAVDLGGLHPPEDGSVTIDRAHSFGMKDGSVYRINIFHAERKVEGSSFKLTLGGFNMVRSYCKAECGDGVLSLGEQCDDGINDGSYGGCTEDCKLGAFCGDGIVQEEYEDCDDGNFKDHDDCPSSCRIIVIEVE
jgi:fibro-slime domain-containing protein